MLTLIIFAFGVYVGYIVKQNANATFTVNAATFAKNLWVKVTQLDAEFNRK